MARRKYKEMTFPKTLVNFCVTCLGSHPARVAVDSDSYMTLTCIRCKSESITRLDDFHEESCG